MTSQGDAKVFRSWGGKDLVRCAWCRDDPLLVRYHDEEWGVPEQDSVRLFAKLCLDGLQAGLSWRTILLRREALNDAFFAFVPERVAVMTSRQLESRMHNAAIIRNRQKIWAMRSNARAYLRLQKIHLSFARFVWQFVGNTVQQHDRLARASTPTVSPQAKALSLALKKWGFSFCGPVIVYAFMQATGLVNDHSRDCFCFARLNHR